MWLTSLSRYESATHGDTEGDDAEVDGRGWPPRQGFQRAETTSALVEWFPSGMKSMAWKPGAQVRFA